MDPLSYGKKEFNKHRKLFLQNVPPVTHQDVRNFLGDIVPADIVISKRLYHVIITLKCCDKIDYALQTLQNKLLAGHKVKVELYPRRMMLYICGVPLHYNGEMYRDFLSNYGIIETAFLSLTSKGDSKGLGFVEFAHSRSRLEKVQKSIHGSTLNGSQLYCGLVSDHILTYEHTISKTLFCVCDADQIPVNNKLMHLGQVYHMPDDKRSLYFIDCPDERTAECIWYESLQFSSSSKVSRIQYAMPMVSLSQLAHIVNDMPVKKYPPLSNLKEVRHMLQTLLGRDKQAVESVENYIYATVQRSLWGSTELTPTLLSEFLQSTNNNHPQIPTTVAPLPNLQHSLRHDSMISEECRRRNRSEYKTRSAMRMASVGPSDSIQQVPQFLCPTAINSTEQVLPMSHHATSNSIRQVLPVSRPATSHTMSNSSVSTNSCSVRFSNANITTTQYSGPVTRQRKLSMENMANVTTLFRRTPGSKASKRERPVLFEADLNVALPQLFSRKRKVITTTPKVLRKLLPEPEKSPGSPRLIGQHSQGIGGHYADSYQPSSKIGRML